MKNEKRIEVLPGVFYDVPDPADGIAYETLYENLPKTDQYWRRETDFPQFFFDYNPHLAIKTRCRINASRTEYRHGQLFTLSVEDTIEMLRLLKRETERMRYGIFIMNAGEKIYFPGVYYGALQWGKMFGVTENDGYGEHRRYQRLYACARQLCIENPQLDGYYVHKPKKTGITQLASLFLVISALVTKQFTAAVMSKSHDTSKKANFVYFMYAFKNLPPVLRPKTEQKDWQNAVQKLEIKCGEPALSMDNTIAAVATTVSGLDGLPPTNIIQIDEGPKFPKQVDIEKVYTKAREQVRIQQTKVGILEMFSYPPEEDTPAFYWCKKFYENCTQVKENGLPVNGMLPIFISVIDSSNGTFDKYGEPDKFKALQEEQAARVLCTTPYQLQARKRQYPVTAKEGWESGGSGSVYNNIALTEQETILEEQYKFGELNYLEGNLEWDGVRMISKVSFVPLTHEQVMNGESGLWKIYCTLEYLEQHTNLCFKMERKIKIINKERHELLQPPDYVFHASGTDPVDYARVSELGQKQSKNASVVKDIQGNLLSVYHNRSENPDDDIENFCKEIVFFGSYALVEGNRKNAITELENQGLWYFLLVRHPNGQVLPYLQGMSIKHINSTPDIKSRYIALQMKKIKNNIGQFTNPEIIRQHKEFDPIETQKFDLAVADNLSEVAVDAMKIFVMSKKTAVDRYAMMGNVLAKVM